MTIDFSASTSFPFTTTEASPVVEYEFTEYENVVISKLGGRLQTYSTLMLVIAAAQIAGGVAALKHTPVSLFANVIVAAFLAVFAAITRGAARELKLVVNTAGSDVSHLITALGKLSTWFGIQVASTALWAVFSVLIAVFAFVG